MNLSPTPYAALPGAANPFIGTTYRTPSFQHLYNQYFQAPFVSVDFKPLTVLGFRSQLQQNQYLRTPLASVASKELITLLDATLTSRSPHNSFKCNTYKKGGVGHQP